MVCEGFSSTISNSNSTLNKSINWFGLHDVLDSREDIPCYYSNSSSSLFFCWFCNNNTFAMNRASAAHVHWPSGFTNTNLQIHYKGFILHHHSEKRHVLFLPFLFLMNRLPLVICAFMPLCCKWYNHYKKRISVPVKGPLWLFPTRTIFFPKRGK